MHRRFILHTLSQPLAVVAVLGVLAVPTVAQRPPVPSMETGPADGYDSGQTTFFDVKSPPLETSDGFFTTWALRLTSTAYNYAGLVIDLRFDPHEVSALYVAPTGIHGSIEPPRTMATGLYGGWTFVPSNPSAQSMSTFSPIALWGSTLQAANSGTTVDELNTALPIFWVSGHATNTAPCNNSDIDITISVWRIMHIADTQFVQLGPGSWIYVTPGGTDLATAPGAGIWQQLTTQLSATLAPSAFIATNVNVSNVAGYGIEHVPEPMSVLLLLAGTGTVLVGRTRRRGGV